MRALRCGRKIPNVGESMTGRPSATQPDNWLMSPEDRICFEHRVAAT